jgi:large subunit ribosomal protein L4
MPTVDVFDLHNRKVAELDLADSVFGAPPNEPLIHQAVVAYRATMRAGTHKTKGRGEVAGSGRKPWRQKGTGRARIGSRRSPLWRGGGTAHGPRTRSHAKKLPRKMLLAALRSALSARLGDSCVTVVRDFDLPSHKTREFRGVLAALGTSGSVLVVNNGPNENLARSSRNLPDVELISSAHLHPYVVLKYRRILISAQAARKCCEVLA